MKRDDTMNEEEAVAKDEGKDENMMQRFLNKEGILKIIVFIGIAGIALIFGSSLFTQSRTQDNTTAEVSVPDTESATGYKQELCDELGYMLASIDGAGKTKVMVTLDGTVRNIYATDNDIKQNESSQKTGSGENTTKQNDEKKTCIVVRMGDGSEQALTIGQLMPSVKGVLVVCQGGGSEEVRSRIKQAVSAALGIKESHICVLKMN